MMDVRMPVIPASSPKSPIRLRGSIITSYYDIALSFHISRVRRRPAASSTSYLVELFTIVETQAGLQLAGSHYLPICMYILCQCQKQLPGVRLKLFVCSTISVAHCS